MRIFPLILTGLVALAATGCHSSSTRKIIPLDRFQRIYVERRLNENNHLDEILAAELQRIGRTASAGPLTMMPENTDAILTYDARWAWDFKTYLLELNVELHAVHPHKKLADGRYYQPSITTKAPAEAVRAILEPLFAKP